ncbi:MAG: bifunctional methylenetetrahydrofolate dehydrogenase/methenyltetrahydrofolate cyclohydrolase FolD [Eubacteriales bacterium]|nr:bifunctional methylenetetrahydrofolate dehydrogenase/methenyltetrahydrofolate cyclohydrolase FolD [Eubacteriales bacterium]MDY2602352.1 bifunctional methylenetetrahydrofolate dehydrogenase/methenyltetrahydrofolate cyclohydrolase FolD [Eubacteriales bacterium]
MAQLIDGKAIAAEITEEMRLRAQALREKGIVPCLAVILAGNDPASEIYVRNKRRACKRAGIESRMIRLDQSVSREEILREIYALNQDPAVHAVLVQLPLPGHLDETEILSAVLPEKDADGFHPLNAGRLLTGEKGVLPCTPAGCMELLRRTGVSLSGAEAVVIGRSNIVGKPMSLLLLRENCTVTLCHSRTKNLAEHVRRADVVICAVGRPGLVTGEMIKPGATVIDVGINRLADGRVVGDADFESVSAVAGAITPVPGGVGPMTIAMLMKNAILAAERL